MTPECALVRVNPDHVASCKDLPNLQVIIDEFVQFKKDPPEEIKDEESMESFDMRNCKQKCVKAATSCNGLEL